MWPRPRFWRIGPYNPREPDPAYWLIVLGGVAAISFLLGSGVHMQRSAMEYERERYPTTGGLWIGIAFAELCTGSVGAVLLVLLGLYVARHRPLD